MHCFLFAVLSLAVPLGAFALTWDFADGSTWGWTAQEGFASNTKGIPEPLQSEVVDGVWRIATVPGRRPTVQLRSPLLGKDSALFDRLTLRLRIIHHSPTEGDFSMFWSNAEYRLPSEGRFSTGRLQPYPIEWEDITLDLRAAAEANRKWPITWLDTLFNFYIDMMLYRDSQDIDNHPKFLEIDWIQLTGAEELAQGKLSPADIAVGLGPPGTLFAEPDFFPLSEGIGSPRRELQGAVGDVDGDGDADLVVAWNRFVDREIQRGWTVASNDGLGRFEPTQEFLLSTASVDGSYSIIALRGSDFDGDGLLDLVVSEGVTVELWYNWGDGFDPTLQLSDVWLVGLADGDGDGDTDLLVAETGSQVILWINDGYDFVISDRFVLDSEEVRFPSLPAGQSLGEAASLLWRQPCNEPPGSWQLTRPWAAIQEPPLAIEAPVNTCAPHLLADLDGNGTVDLLGSSERETFLDPNYYYGLALWRMDASGGWTRHSLLDWKVLPSIATTSDLNGDGVLDVTLLAGNSAHRSGTGGIARPAQRRTRPRRLLPPAKRRQSGSHQRPQRRWRHRSGRDRNQSCKRPRRSLRL